MSNIDKVQQVTNCVVELLPTIERKRAEKLADLVVNHPNVYPNDSFSFDECAAFVTTKYKFNSTQSCGK